MSSLQALTSRIRLVLSEEAKDKKEKAPKLKMNQKTKVPKKRLNVKQAEPSENIPESLLKTANYFRDSLKFGDEIEQLSADLSKAVKNPALGGESREDRAAKRAAMDVEAVAMKMDKTVREMNSVYKWGRQEFYSIAKAWDMYRKGETGAHAAKKDIADASDKELADVIAWNAKKLAPMLRDFLEKSARANKVMRNAAKKTGLDFEELTDSEKKAIVDAGFDLRNAAEPLFGMVGSILKRTREMLERIREEEAFKTKYESLDNAPFSWQFDESLYQD